MTSKSWDKLLVVGFMTILSALGGGAFLTQPSTAEENRGVAPLPGLAVGRAEFTRGFQAFLDDHLPGRQWMLTNHARWKTRVLGTTPTLRVIQGRNEWLFLGDDESRRCMRADGPWDPASRDAWVGTVTSLHRQLAAQGVALLFVVVPAKSTIHPEHVPAWMQPTAASRMDELYSVLSASGVPSLDLRPALLAAKRERPLYQRLDTHWNADGSYVGYVEIVRALQRLVPAVPAPNPPSAFQRVDAVGSGDLARAMALSSDLTEAIAVRRLAAPRARKTAEYLDPAREPRHRMSYEVNDPALPRAVIFRDSFAIQLVDDIAEHFQSSEFLWTVHPDLDVVRTLRPDVVIYEVAERFLYGRTPRLEGGEPAESGRD